VLSVSSSSPTGANCKVPPLYWGCDACSPNIFVNPVQLHQCIGANAEKKMAKVLVFSIDWCNLVSSPNILAKLLVYYF